VLFLGVALLGWMAWRLGRQIGAAPGKTPAERTDA
jgi:threonine/homoserine/homoserine lactone efflux protein